jgi:hypothetical protein
MGDKPHYSLRGKMWLDWFGLLHVWATQGKMMEIHHLMDR